MQDWLAKAFPQKADISVSSAPRHMRRYGPERARDNDGAWIIRPESVTSWDHAGSVLYLEVEQREYQNRLVQTHETEMFQFGRLDGKGAARLRVEWFADGILRVRYGDDVDATPYDSFLTKDERMLCAEPQPPNAQLSVADDALTFNAGDYSLVVERSPFRMRVRRHDGTVVWQQKKRDLFTADVIDMCQVESDTITSTWESFDLRERERIVGLGERFDAVVRNGRRVDFRNKDAIGTSNTRTYINVPFALSSAGYGVFVNSSANPHFEIGTHDLSAFGIAVEDTQLDYFLCLGDDPSAILRGYHFLTGAPAIPPVWSYGLWLSRNSYVSWDVVDDVVSSADVYDIPFDVVHLDTAWFTEDWNCDLRFSEERFGEPERRMAALRDRGIRVSLWQYNFIPNRGDNRNLTEARERGLLVAGPDGCPYAYPPDVVGSWIDDAILDFTNPETNDWYARQIADLVHAGAAAIKVDFGEGVPDEGAYCGISGSRVHNLYSLAYTATIAKATHSVSGEWIVWARSGTAGSQRYPVHWGGDSQCSWAGLAGTLKAALSLGLSGFPFFSHDIGGYIGRPDQELYIRWAQFGLLSSHARTHGVGDDNSREPWTFGDDALRIFREFAHLRYRLLPYLVQTGEDAVATGKPVVRALCLEFPDDDTAWTIEDQYMLGDALLVAPVLRPREDERARRVYLPRDTWFDYWTGERIESRGEWIERPVELDTIPIFGRAGGIVPMQSYRSRTDNTAGPIVRVLAFPGRDGTHVLRDARGVLEVSLVGDSVTVSRAGVAALTPTEARDE
jgi:alpha-D-xyloside xylohydrolase